MNKKHHELGKVNQWGKTFTAESIGGVYPISQDDQLIINSMTAKQLKLVARMISSAHNYGHHKNREHWKQMTRDQRRAECREETMGKLIVLHGGKNDAQFSEVTF